MTAVVISGGLAVDTLIKKQWLSTTLARKTAETIGTVLVLPHSRSCQSATVGFVKS